jgi:hypothetical protein
MDGMPAEEDAEAEGAFSLFELPSELRQRRPEGLRTVGEAYALCRELIVAQVDKAVAQSARPNASISGDSAARAAFLLLLPDEQKRALFLETARRTESWPRIRPLFGAPPFAFLRPEDAGMLRAAGFANKRANMAYERGGMTANIGQFGPGQLQDEHTREYRLAPRVSSMQDPLPGGDFFEAVKGDLLLQVKVQRRSKSEKQQLFQSIFKKRLFFPQPGMNGSLEPRTTQHNRAFLTHVNFGKRCLRFLTCTHIYMLSLSLAISRPREPR